MTDDKISCIACNATDVRDAKCFWCVVAKRGHDHPIEPVCPTCAGDPTRLQVTALRLLVSSEP